MRILIAKIGLDGHDRGAKIIANLLKECGHEVIYSGLHNSIKEIIKIVIEEDVDIIGISLLSGSHFEIVKDFIGSLNGIENNRRRSVFVGGTIPRTDLVGLLELGVERIFPTGTSLIEIENWAKSLVQ